jgi:hypothetical protein
MRVPAVKAATMTGGCACKSVPRDIGDVGGGGRADVQSGSARFLNCGTILPAEEAGVSLGLSKAKHRYTQMTVKSDNGVHGEESPPVLEHEGELPGLPEVDKRTKERQRGQGEEEERKNKV